MTESKETKPTREVKPVEESIGRIGELAEKAPELIGVSTGVEGLDELFFTVEWTKKGKPKKKPLGGIPLRSVINITGVADTGKTLMAEQFTVKQASLGYPVIFVSVESPGPFVAASLKHRAKAMGIEEEKVEQNAIIIDAASHSILREDIPTLLATLAHAIKTYKTKSVVIDSVTGLYEAKEMLARSVVRSIFNFLKKWYQTGLLISQKRSGHEELSAEAAGGYAVAHIVDGTIVVSKELITSQRQANLYKKPIGDIVRLFRIDGCRLCGHDTKVRYLEITEEGLVKIGPPIGQE
ncbi:circadian clock protein KaiC [Thermosulfidibacter takaii ABI70S6]|uniref:Circadian clock protein KaiC n=1 Tax=Thermosulfidibacter takaii (strain DSM 17441 / JCM 13301 / NBRC 103674 / ABI70S6) TaxID=1298851 RepID=A0A0S3QTJ3_THET7|nr:KaiC domain-containing protein [Thermosulfidibacter takaii]BAT71647.1 circadian clock protein KaiC [Thermosulfidibacter takaii ABI70S6]